MSPAIRILFRLASRLPDAFIVAGNRVGAYYGALLRPRGHGRPVVEIQAPVDCARFNLSAVAGAASEPSQTYHVVSVGNINPLKGFEDFLDMAAVLNGRHPGRFRFTICGPIYESQRHYAIRLTRYAKERALANFELQPGQPDVRPIVAGADIYVCSSIAEASPMALWEAMSMGKAVVSTDVADVERFLEGHHAGVVVPVRNSKALANAVETLVFNPDLRHIMEGNARAVALANFDISRCVERHEQLYRTLIRYGAPARSAASGDEGQE
jgi:glycosyltransferase involved in cell wall biosynthesis